uniref:J domain-containing protein n=1 Tax=Rhodosorus marinus TaxID=101924 RepID=A0A7S0BT51_9RHOD|mmetsp:Transcript_8091/g.11994  ORF Transcript_8091/g.11994 Transcript_8091/m.11994 type:complete len:368 (+) Transcript_8091:131-1234(+)
MSKEAEEYKNLGNDAYASGRHTHAIAYYTTAIELDPTNAALFSNRAAAYTKIEEFQKAKYDADMCIELRPEWPKGYWRKGTAEIEAQEYKQAVATFEKGLERSPTDQNLVDGKRKALQMLAVVDNIVGQEYGEFDIDAPAPNPDPVPEPAPAAREADITDAQPTTAPMGDETWPGTMEEEVERINNATDHYSILHVPQDASPEQLRKNYHTLAKMLHPDKCKLPRGEEAMKNLSIAYGTLNNDVKRRNYDAYMDARKENGGNGETFAEWDHRRQETNLPPWVLKIQQYRGCALVLLIILLIILIPLVLLFVVVVLIFYFICVFPRECVLRCCFPEQWEEYKVQKAEEQRKARQRMDEEMQDALHRNV